MAGAMWDVEAKAVAGATRDRGEPVVMISGEGMRALAQGDRAGDRRLAQANEGQEA